MTERERFESWARQRWTHPEDFDQRIKAPSKYNNYEVQAAWDAWQERAAQNAPSVPEGYKLVPIEPTPTMVKAGLESSHVLNVHRVLACYDAMINTVQPALSLPSVPTDVITDYLVSISAHLAHQDDRKAQAEIGELLKMLAAAPEAKP